MLHERTLRDLGPRKDVYDTSIKVRHENVDISATNIEREMVQLQSLPEVNRLD